MSHEIVGKWRVTVSKWIWEYTFDPNGVVRWRDPLNNEAGTGKWSITTKTVMISWAPKSTTRENWYLPISSAFQTGDYQASYGKFTLVAERLSRGPAEDESPQFVKPPWSSSSAGAKTTASGQLWRQELDLGGNASVGLTGWNGLSLGFNNPAIATASSFVDKVNDLLGIDVVGTQTGDANLEARRNNDVVAFMQIHVSSVAATKAVYVDNFVTAYYDPDFHHQGGNFSKYILLHYTDDVVISINIDQIGGNRMDDAAAIQSIRAGAIGEGGRRFPNQMNASTTPRLHVAKRQAIEIMETENIAVLRASVAAVVFIVSMRPLEIGGPLSPRRPVLRVSLPRAAQNALAAGGQQSRMIVVTEEMIREAVKDAPLKTQQAGGVSLPRVQRFVNMLLKGEKPPPIKVDNGIIVEGNHRYIAGRIYGEEPPIQQWMGGRPERVINWNALKISNTDW